MIGTDGMRTLSKVFMTRSPVKVHLVFERELVVKKNHQVFITVLTNVDWEKPEDSFELIFLTPRLLTTDVAADAARVNYFLYVYHKLI